MYNSKKIDANGGVLTAEILEDGLKSLLDRGLRPAGVVPIPKDIYEGLVAYDKLEKEWNKLPLYLAKQMKLKYNIKCKRARGIDNKPLPLPE